MFQCATNARVSKVLTDADKHALLHSQPILCLMGQDVNKYLGNHVNIDMIYAQ